MDEKTEGRMETTAELVVREGVAAPPRRSGGKWKGERHEGKIGCGRKVSDLSVCVGGE